MAGGDKNVADTPKTCEECSRALWPIVNDAGQVIGHKHTPEANDHHYMVTGSYHDPFPGAPLQESDLDVCSNCNHLRGQHQDWPSGVTCSGLDDVTVEHDECPCGEFKS